MKKIIAVLSFVAMAVSGCAGHGNIKDINREPENDDKLVQAAQEIKSEMLLINDLSPNASSAKPPANFNRSVSIDYDGDIDGFMTDLKNSKMFDVRIVGRKPVQDLVISLHHKRDPLWKVLEDVGVQIGRFGTITIKPGSVILTYVSIN